MKTFVVSLFLVIFPSFILSQTATPKARSIAKTDSIYPGVVVDEVTKNSAGEQAGLREGDVLLVWQRGDVVGIIESPFDFSNLAIEQGPRGMVSIKGLRGSEESMWTIAPGSWGLKTRPNFPQSLLLSYLENRKMVQSGKWTEAAEQSQTISSHLDDSTMIWFRLWLLSQAADGFVHARDWKNADEVYQQSLELAGDALPSVRGLLLRAWANTYRQRSDWLNAEKYYQQSISETRKAGLESLTLASTLDDLGTISMLRGDLMIAEERYRQALEIKQKLAPSSLDVAASLNNLGIVASKRGDLAKAEEYLHHALEIRQQLAPESLDIAATLNVIGIVSRQRGNLADAEEFFHHSLEIRQKLTPGSLEVASTLSNLGNVAKQRGDLAKAEEYYRQGLEIRQKLAPGSMDLTISLESLGNVAERRGNLDKAEEYHRQALYIEQQLSPESLDVASSLNNLGSIARQRGDLAKAEDYYRHALEISQKLAPGSLFFAVGLSTLGDVARQRGDLAKAEEYYRQALDIRQRLAPGSLDVGDSLNSLGIVARKRGDLAEAEEYYRQALEIAEKLNPGSLDVAVAFNNLGNIAIQRGNLGKGEGYYRQALEIRKKFVPGSLLFAESISSLANAAQQQGDLTRAEQYARQALDIVQKQAPGSMNVASIFATLGDVLQQRGDLGRAEECYRQVLEIRKKIAPQSGDYAESLAALAEIVRRKEQIDQAVQLYQQAVDVLQQQMAIFGGSEETRSSFRSNHLDLYMGYIDLLVSQKQTEMAFQILERSRAQGLLETLMAAQVDIRKGVNGELVEKERSLRELLTTKSNRRMRLLSDKFTEVQASALDKEIAEILKEYQEVEGQIRQASPGYAALTQPHLLSVKEVQQSLLDSDTLLLEYALGEERSYVFAVTQNSIAAFALPKRADIDTRARALYSLLSDYGAENKNVIRQSARAPEEYTKVVTRLSEIVLGPVANQLSKKRLLVVSDGGLQYIPFSVLNTPEDPAAPLIAKHEIVNLPSVLALTVLHQELSGRKPAPKVVAVLADPVFDVHDDRLRASGNEMPHSPGSSEVDRQSTLDRSAQEVGLVHGGVFPRLPFSRREAEAIYSIAQKGEAMKALDFEASKATAMMPQLRDYRVVHFATHGLLNSEHPELSGLVFSLVDRQGKTQDGFLRLLDIYNLDLNADLVVLSACQTALGKQIEKEGLVGLTRGFMYAGAPRVMASLWKVDDEATAKLMKRFYEGVLKNAQTPAQALRTAQLWMSQQKRWRMPYYWAGFVLQGEWK